jgi:bifunctional non-homologous end joining protein LigD
LTSAKESSSVAKINVRAPCARATAPKPLKVRRHALPAPPPLRDVAPELATLVDEPPRGDNWIYETKYDGYRILARVQNGQVALATRNGNDFSARAPKVIAALLKLSPDGLLLDGELVSPPRKGGSKHPSNPHHAGDFQALQNALREGRSAELVYFVFDCLFMAGEDLRPQPLHARQQALARVIARDGPVLRRSKHLRGSGSELLREACKLGFEGIIAKRSDAPYRAGRGKDWLKLKCTGREEFVIVGFTSPGGSRPHLGALLLATRNAADQPLTYAGKVGTGFSMASLRELSERLRPLVRATPAFAGAPRGAEARAAKWVEPKLLAEVSFTELTSDGRLRHPSFQGLRSDKAASAVVRERKAPAPRAARSAREE